METKTKISLTAVVAIIIATLALTTGYTRCSSGWLETDQIPIHYCEDRDMYRACDHLSSTGITCYHYDGEVPGLEELEFFANGENYSCLGTKCYSPCKSISNKFAYYGELRSCK